MAWRYCRDSLRAFAHEMTRLLTTPTPTYEPNETRAALVADLRAHRAALSLCAARMVPTSESIRLEVGRIRRLCDKAEELAGRIVVKE